jgi:transformation/transcription domain-associated protein
MQPPFPNDVDVLFELQIFLQPTTCDFGFIRSFLAHTVSNVTQPREKRHIMQRFLALMVGEGPEETKVLSVQLMVIPMLLNTFNCQCKNSTLDDESPAFVDVSEENVKDGDEFTTDADLVDPDTVKKFVQEVLLKNGSPGLYGDRVRVELLRLSTLLIRSKPRLMDAHQKDLIKFSWGLLKSDDMSCKGWAYLNVCSFISAFENSRQNRYPSLYRSRFGMHRRETKEYVRSALSLLVPSLLRKLDQKEFRELIESTARLLHEEGNNVPQLAHIWQTIGSYPSVFVANRVQFLRHMVKSLSMLGELRTQLSNREIES